MLRQLVELIPGHLVPTFARECGIHLQARLFSAWSHLVSMLYAQISRSHGLNEVCDSLSFHLSDLLAMRGATALMRNSLSHANKTRDCAFAEKLYWGVFERLKLQFPRFASGATPGYLRRFRSRSIHVVDSTTVQLVVNCIDWARRRARKAAAKIHTRIGLSSFLPAFAIVGSAGGHDSVRAPELCASLQEGEVVIFGKVCVHFKHLGALDERGVCFVTREKTNLKTKRKKKLPRRGDKRILADDMVVLTGKETSRDYPQTPRRVRAIVEVDG